MYLHYNLTDHISFLDFHKMMTLLLELFNNLFTFAILFIVQYKHTHISLFANIMKNIQKTVWYS